MIIPAAQPLSIRRQGSTEYDYANLLGGGIRNGYIVEEGERLLVEKRGGFAIQTAGVPTIDTGDYCRGVAGVTSYVATAIYDASLTDTVWYNGPTLRGTIGTGSNPTGKVFFGQLDSYEIAMNNSENVAYTFNGALAQITDPDFPASPAYGFAILNGRMYVGDRSANARLLNSAEGNPTSYLGTDYIEPYRSSDSIKAVLNHMDNVAVFGNSSLEFFYDNANPSGSPLRRREDVYYEVGVYSTNSMDTLGGTIYFVGGIASSAVSTRQKLGVYALNGFVLKKISTDAIDAVLADTATTETWGSCLSAIQGGRPMYLLNKNIASSTGDVTFAYDIEKDFWYVWSYADQDAFKIVGQVSGSGVVSTSNVLFLYDGTALIGGTNELFQDNGTNYPFTIRTSADHYRANSRRKFFNEFSVIGDYCTTGSWSVRFSDNDFSTYSTARTLDATKFAKLSAMGSAYRRAWECSITANTRARIEGFDLGDVQVGL